MDIVKKFLTSMVICLLAVFTLTLTACTVDNGHSKIATDYANLYNGGNIVSFECYGEFNGTHVVLFEGAFGSGVLYEIVDEVVFYHSVPNRFMVYNNGEFFRLNKAFDLGLLTHEDLLTLKDNYEDDVIVDFPC